MADPAAPVDVVVVDSSAPLTATAPPKTRHTFGAPRGTVRALLALCVAGSAYWLLANPAVRMAHYAGSLPEELLGALLIVLGYYFADRAGQEDAPKSGMPPMWLPTGTIRALLVTGFIAAVGWLIYQKYSEQMAEFNFFALPAAGIIVTITSFFFGRLGRMVVKGFANKGRTALAAVIGDLKGLIGVAGGVGTVVIYCMPELQVPLLAPEHTPELRTRFLELFPSLISFYFGTR